MSLRFRVVLIEPMQEGNVGSVCRAMKNFGFDDLVLVNPCSLGDFAKAMASHAVDILKDARTVSCFEDALTGIDLIVATTGKMAEGDRRPMRRRYFTPAELKDSLKDKDGTVALVFGREDHGLVNEDLERCDLVVTIPASDEYPILNLSQAALIIMYELSDMNGGDFPLATRDLMEKLYDNLEGLLEDIDYPRHKKDNTSLMLRRILGRAMVGSNEYYTLMGVIRETRLAIERKEKEER
jgi:tRNA/rRNA methyltransferase